MKTSTQGVATKPATSACAGQVDWPRTELPRATQLREQIFEGSLAKSREVTMERKLIAQGQVFTTVGSHPVAGLSVRIEAVQNGGRNRGATGYKEMRIAEAITAGDGSFVLLEDRPLSNSVGPIEHCMIAAGAWPLHLKLSDTDGCELARQPFEMVEPPPVLSIRMDLGEAEPTTKDMKEAARILSSSQTTLTGRVAEELATLGPTGVFRDWSASRRHCLLRAIEEALLDPTGQLRAKKLTTSVAAFGDPAFLATISKQIGQRPSIRLREAINFAQGLAESVGNLMSGQMFIDSARIAHSGLVGAIYGNRNDISVNIWGEYVVPDFMRDPRLGYRDYLRGIWVDRTKNSIRPLTLQETGIIDQLSYRFFQDFLTQDTSDRTANEVVIPILRDILTTPKATNPYGFGVNPTNIEPRGERSAREYLDYLIALSSRPARELENRYRLNLHRDDMALSNAVWQNVETLQRFFSDSFQSAQDPHVVHPNLSGSLKLPLIWSSDLGGGKFFLGYDEWLENLEPRYWEDYFDIRARFRLELPDAERQQLFATTLPAAEFVRRRDSGEFYLQPSNMAPDSTRLQELRCATEFADTVQAAHKLAQRQQWAQARGLYLAANGLVKGMFGGIQMSLDPKGTFERVFAITSLDSLKKFEQSAHVILRREHFDNAPSFRVKPAAYDALFPSIQYLISFGRGRLLAACIAECSSAIGDWADASDTLDFVLPFRVGQAHLESDPFTGSGGGPAPGMLPFTTANGERPLTYVAVGGATITTWLPSNPVERSFFRLFQGDVMLDWADQLFRSDAPDSIMRARELYKGVLYLNGEDPNISPLWGSATGPIQGSKVSGSQRNPRRKVQITRARLGFLKIEEDLNFYGYRRDHVPPVRYQVLKDHADKQAAAAKAAEIDFISYLERMERAELDAMAAEAQVVKAGRLIQITVEKTKIAEFYLGEAKKQVTAVEAQIAAKEKEIADADSLVSQFTSFFKGLGDSVGKLKDAFGTALDNPQEPAGTALTVGDVAKIAGSKDIAAAAAKYGAGVGLMGAFGVFVYSGYNSMEGMVAEANRRNGELNHLRNVALPGARVLQGLKEREVRIAGHEEAIARDDWQYGKRLLNYHDGRFLNRTFWSGMATLAQRLVRRYLDLAGEAAWLAERSLAFSQDRSIRCIELDYYSPRRRGVGGADMLRLHLAELEAGRIHELGLTVPVKVTLSLARTFPISFAALKSNGRCHFVTLEQMLTRAYPGVYGYRIRCATVAIQMIGAAEPPRGLLSNSGVSLVSRAVPGSRHLLRRYADAQPLSEFNIRSDMAIYDLPGESLLPFEGSGFECGWELSLIGYEDGRKLTAVADVLLTFDLCARYSAVRKDADLTIPAAAISGALLLSGSMQNPGAFAAFAQGGPSLELEVDPRQVLGELVKRKPVIQNLGIIAVGDELQNFTVEVTQPVSTVPRKVKMNDGIALSNSGVLSRRTGGPPEPLNAFVGGSATGSMTLTVVGAASPPTIRKNLRDLLLVIDYATTA